MKAHMKTGRGEYGGFSAVRCSVSPRKDTGQRGLALSDDASEQRKDQRAAGGHSGSYGEWHSRQGSICVHNDFKGLSSVTCQAPNA